MRRLTGTVQPYAWGSPTRIPELLGTTPDGTPQAELWLGAHPKAPSVLAGSGPLTDAIAADPDGLLGADTVRRFGPRLPYLLKVLAADQPLSLQAHPARRQAEAGFARERAAGVAADDPERVFADDWPKPEMFCALSPAQVLCGFREPTLTHALFEALGADEILRLVGPLAEGGAERLAEVVARLLRLPDAEHGALAQVVTAAAEVVAEPGGSRGRDPELIRFAATAVELDRFYPGDPGILAALLMNRMSLAPGDAVYLPAGNLHAYLHGYGVEIMANSDNVLRGGLTGKFVAADELLDVLGYGFGVPPLVEVVEEPVGVFRYATPAPEFTLWRLEPDGGPLPVPAPDQTRVLLVTDGRLSVTGAGDQLELDHGQALLAGPGEELLVSGAGTGFVAGPGPG